MPKKSTSSITEAYHWVSILMTVTMEMVLPIWGGSWLDKRWETGPALTIVGAALGMFAAITHLMQLTSTKSKSKSPRDKTSQDDSRNANKRD